MNDVININDIKDGYVVKTAGGTLFLVQTLSDWSEKSVEMNGKPVDRKVLINDQGFLYLDESFYDVQLECRLRKRHALLDFAERRKELDIKEVWGFHQPCKDPWEDRFSMSNIISTNRRALIWKR